MTLSNHLLQESGKNQGGSAICNMISSAWSLIIGVEILKATSWAVIPRTPFYLRKRIRYLENELIAKTCSVNEEVIRP